MARALAILLIGLIGGCRFVPYTMQPNFPACFRRNTERVEEAALPCQGETQRKALDGKCFLLRDQLPHVYNWIRLVDAECEAWRKQSEVD